MKRWQIAGVLALLALWTTTAAGARGDGDWQEEVVERTLELGGGNRVSVESRNGGIEVRSWDRSEVKVVATKRARSKHGDTAALLAKIEVDIEQTADGVRIATRLPSQKGWGRGVGYGVEYELTVPRHVTLVAESSNGSVDVSDIDGEARLSTVNGRILADRIGGSLDASTTNGSIRARGVGGRVEASSTNGSIDAEMLADYLAEDIEFSTTNGSIDLRLDPGLAASIEARSSNGTISGELYDRHGDSGDRRSRRHASFDLNGGGPRIVLRTTNGRIRLREH